jgi:peptidoglycan/LPS O-acetylase OafA/YrhL
MTDKTPMLLEGPWSSISLAAAATSKDNNFRIIRHVAAAAVIFSHAFIVNYGYEALKQEPFKATFGASIAEIAVNVFFIVSGFLVTNSLLSRGNLADFFASRALRIYPGLIVLVLLSALVLGPLTTELPLAQYFSHRPVYSFIVYDSLAISPFHIRYGLPDVFPSLPYPDVVNASIWTLPWEIWMYLSLAAMFVVGLLRRPLLWAVPIYAGYVATEAGLFQDHIMVMIGFRFLAFFYSGALASIYRDKIPLSPLLAAVFAAAFIFVTWLIRKPYLLPFLLAYTVMFLAYYPALITKKLSHGADISYGIYIYAYPIQQLLVWKFGPHDPYLHSVIALAITLVPAYLSWTYIESPSLALKSRIRDRYISAHLKSRRPTIAE